MSKVTGAAEVAADLHALGPAILEDLGPALVGAARTRAAALAPTLAQLDTPVVDAAGATLNYSGVIEPDGFQAHLEDDLADTAAQAADDQIDTTIQRAGFA